MYGVVRRAICRSVGSQESRNAEMPYLGTQHQQKSGTHMRWSFGVMICAANGKEPKIALAWYLRVQLRQAAGLIQPG